jgi:hypothetical protein
VAGRRPGLLVAALLSLWSAIAFADARVDLAHMLSHPSGIAHRTADLDVILRSGWILSGHAAAERRLLRSYELPFKQRRRIAVRTDGVPPDVALHTEIFGTTRGILRSNTEYGRYGLVWLSSSLKQSPYLNFVPNEVVAEHPTKVLEAVAVVPGLELAEWQRRYPGQRFVAEEHVPSERLLRGRSLAAIPMRLFRRLKLWLKHGAVPVAGKMESL